MKYFLIIDKTGDRSLIVAESLKFAMDFVSNSASDSDSVADYGFELLPDTFASDSPGYLMSDKDHQVVCPHS